MRKVLLVLIVILTFTIPIFAQEVDTAWVRIYNGAADSEDCAQAVVVDNSGNVYVTGWSYGSGTNFDYVTIKYNSQGNQLWIERYDGPGNGSDKAYAMALDNSGSVYVTGWSFGSGTYSDYATIKYDSQGNELWVERYSGSANGEETGRDIAVDNSGNVYVTGQSYGNGTGYDYSTIKYIQFWRGDANGDNKVTVSDVVYLINYLFKGGPAPALLKTGDANCDGNVTVADVVYLVNYLFKGGPKPAC